MTDEEDYGDEEFHRADGGCICDDCGLEYRRHPFSGHIGWQDLPYLRRLCDGTLVKL